MAVSSGKPSRMLLGETCVSVHAEAMSTEGEIRSMSFVSLYPVAMKLGNCRSKISSVMIFLSGEGFVENVVEYPEAGSGEPDDTVGSGD